MALEAVVFSHFGYGLPWCDMGVGSGGFSELCAGEYWPADADYDLAVSVAPNADDAWEPGCTRGDQSSDASTDLAKAAPAAGPTAVARRKRRRAKVVKNRDEIESQRMTHIAVERNRRRQMNEYLAMLRSLMPPSYAHRGDQASIVGGAINYVRELEQLLQTLQVQKSIKKPSTSPDAAACESPFAGFFTFPQYSTSSHGVHDASTATGSSGGNTSNSVNGDGAAGGSTTTTDQISICRPTAVADIEVTMAEGHASLKVLARRRPRQLLRLVAGLQQLRVPPLHLNMTTAADAMVLYTFSLKVEDDSKLGSVEDIAEAVHEILRSIQQETAVM